MPLVSLTTSLKDLKYGKDTPGGGWSGQPYIQTKIPDGFTTDSPDFLWRGGLNAPLDSLTDVRRLSKMFFDLKSPQGLFFIAKQQALSNSNVRTQAGGTLNQGVYSPLNTLAQAGVVAFGGHLNKQGIDPTGLSPLSLRTYMDVVEPQVGPSIIATSNNRLVNLVDKKIRGNFIGALSPSLINNNINRISPDVMITYNGGPGSVLGIGKTNIKISNQRTGENNKLARSFGADKAYFYGSWEKGGFLTQLGPQKTGPVILHGQQPTVNYAKDQGAGTTYEFLVNKVIGTLNRASALISGVSGGPSIFFTPLNFNTNHFAAGGALAKQHNVYKQGNTFPQTNIEYTQENGTVTFNQVQLIAAEPFQNAFGVPKDFRKTLIDDPQTGKLLGQPNNNLVLAPDYIDANIANRVHLGNPASPKSRANYNNSPLPLDQINALPLYRASSVVTNDVKPVNDLVKFRMAIIDNDNPSFKTFIHFRAFLDSFSDSFTSEWTDFSYTGRGEKFHTYNGFTRDITLSWTVAAQSRAELIPMYQKLNYLQSVLTPDYSAAGYMRGNLVQLTIGGYIYETVGIIRGFTYDIPQDATWEIGINSYGSGLDAATNVNDEGFFTDFGNVTAAKDIKELPHWLRVTGFRFTPIQSFLPRTQQNNFGSLKKTPLGVQYSDISGFGRQHYISLSNGFTNNYTDAPLIKGTFAGPNNQDQNTPKPLIFQQ
jgi:hypothetical protein